MPELPTDVQTDLVARSSVPPRAPDSALIEKDEVLQRPPRSLWYYSWKRLKRNTLAMAGLIVTILLFVLALLAPFVSPFDPDLQVLEYSTKPSGFHGNVLMVR